MPRVRPVWSIDYHRLPRFDLSGVLISGCVHVVRSSENSEDEEIRCEGNLMPSNELGTNEPTCNESNNSLTEVNAELNDTRDEMHGCLCNVDS